MHFSNPNDQEKAKLESVQPFTNSLTGATHFMISVCICHHKGRLIDLALTSLQKSRGVEFEIIVATSDFPENIENLKIDFPKARFVEIQGGPAYKRNVAVKFAEGEYIAFFDDDVEVQPYALFYMLLELKKENIGMVFGKLLNMEFRNRFDEAGSYLTPTGFLYARAESGIIDHGQFEQVVPVLAGKSAACMIRRKIFWEAGAFDASYEILGEETDLSWRVWLCGYQVLYVPRSITYHAFGTRFKPKDFYVPERIYFNGCRNYLSMIYTNFGKKRWIIPILIQSFVWFFAGIGMLLTGKTTAGSHILNGLFYFIKNIRVIWHKRYKVQKKLRKVQDEKLFYIIMRNPPISYYIKRLFSYIKYAQHGGSYHPVKSSIISLD